MAMGLPLLLVVVLCTMVASSRFQVITSDKDSQLKPKKKVVRWQLNGKEETRQKPAIFNIVVGVMVESIGW
ncbi:hypothetical protein COCNU_16G003050 [Cocos nucifera]|uniref:Uncharacterized protein n=1 Tax=Cocos nucifera TaxID=13894 RepID=A0A8K0NDZ4_COCNU|nr:hypothetical protein COCNU_16G003050 [Cocos nucifera]